MNIAAAMATLKRVRDVDFTARAVLLALACHAHQDDSVAKVRLVDLGDELGLSRGNVMRAVRRAEKAGHLSVEKVGFTGRPWHICVAPARSNELELSARARSIAENAARYRAHGARQRAPIKEESLDLKIWSGDASLAQTASDAEVDARPVDKRAPAGMPPAVASAARAAMQEAAKRGAQ